jgi:hypothetical protein
MDILERRNWSSKKRKSKIRHADPAEAESSVRVGLAWPNIGNRDLLIVRLGRLLVALMSKYGVITAQNYKTGGHCHLLVS